MLTVLKRRARWVGACYPPTGVLPSLERAGAEGQGSTMGRLSGGRSSSSCRPRLPRWRRNSRSASPSHRRRQRRRLARQSIYPVLLNYCHKQKFKIMEHFWKSYCFFSTNIIERTFNDIKMFTPDNSLAKYQYMPWDSLWNNNMYCIQNI